MGLVLFNVKRLRGPEGDPAVDSLDGQRLQGCVSKTSEQTVGGPLVNLLLWDYRQIDIDINIYIDIYV